MENNNHISLLCRNWKFPLFTAAITYSVVQLSMICNFLFAENPVCRSPNFSYWTWHVNFFEVTSFFVVLSIQISHLILKTVPENEIGSYVITFFVSLLAGISSLIKLSTDWSGNCEDVFGVRFPQVLWAEWIVCVPLLYYVVLTTDIKLKLSLVDKIIIILITNVFIFGICMQFTNSYALSVFFLTSSTLCYVVGSIIFCCVTILKGRTQCETLERNEFELRLKKTQIQIALCLLVTLPLYPFVYFLSYYRVIDHDITYTLTTILNVSVKLIFTSLACSAHHNVANEIIRIKLAAETAANNSRRLFVRYIMHEVRVPLSSITMGLGYLSHNPDIDDESKEALLMMEGATGFMKQTLNDVLNMQRIEEGKFQLDFSVFSVERAVHRVRASLLGLITEKQINFMIRIHPGVPEMVIGDGFRIEHVLVNLVSNALKFSQRYSDVVVDIAAVSSKDAYFPGNSGKNISGGNGNNRSRSGSGILGSHHALGFLSSTLDRVSSAASLSKINIFPLDSMSLNRRTTSVASPASPPPAATATIEFSVIDTGPGIAESDLKNLFLPFSQIRPHELQSGGGSGIGLVICKQIVELHGGTIACTSKVGVGSTFTVRIPFEVAGGGGRGGSEKSGILEKWKGKAEEGEEVGQARISNVDMSEDEQKERDDQWGDCRPASRVVSGHAAPPQTGHLHPPPAQLENAATIQTHELLQQQQQLLLLPPGISSGIPPSFFYRDKRGSHISNNSDNSTNSHANIFRQNSHETVFTVNDENDGLLDGSYRRCGKADNNPDSNDNTNNNNNNNNNNDNMIVINNNDFKTNVGDDGVGDGDGDISVYLPPLTYLRINNNENSYTFNRNNYSKTTNNNDNNNISNEEQKTHLFFAGSALPANNLTTSLGNCGHDMAVRGRSQSDNVLTASRSDPLMSATAATARGKKPKIGHVLLVDDVSSNRRILAMLLRQRGVASTMATNGLEGVSTVMEGRQTFDLIFMDNSMPVLTGVEATKQLRSFQYSNLIIGLTGNALEEDVTEFIAAGADAVILKPVTVLQINQILEYAETYGNTHVPNQKLVFTETQSYSTKI